MVGDMLQGCRMALSPEKAAHHRLEAETANDVLPDQLAQSMIELGKVKRTDLARH